MTHAWKLCALAAALMLAVPAAAQNNNSQNSPNGERTDQTGGAAGAVQGRPTTGLGSTYISHEDDIRRTATGKLHMSHEQLAALRTAVSKANLKKQDHVGFTIAVGAAVPEQAKAAPLPDLVAKTVPITTPLNYVYTGGQLILIDRRTGRIVAVVPQVG
jgi:hypothetical protein